MRCSGCGADNHEPANFCEQCGAPFKQRCAKCGFDNSAAARFCGECGGPLKPAATSSATKADPIEAPDVSDGERRHLTVLFSDLVNSTEISAHLDPEEWRDIAADYQRSAADAVTRLGGHVAKYLGDGVMVYFGWPEAHEDDCERAARGGLAIVDAVAALNQRIAGKYRAPKLSVRVGIETGSVVVGHGGGKEADVFGDTPNIASRVQTAAAPDTVVITAAVHQLVSGMFVVEELGPHQLKGIERPVQLYRVIQPSAVRRRTHGGAGRALTTFVGRDDEMRLLLSRWERAGGSEGQLALVVGEAGIGKSRLVEEFHDHIKNDAHLWIECVGEQFSDNTPFHAVIQMLDQGLGWRGDESKEERSSLLERSLELTGMKLAEAMPLIGELLGLPIPPKYPPLPFAPDQKRKRLLANLAGWVINGARMQPVVVAFEDVHWVDPSTLELIQMLAEQTATARLMLLFTARPEFRAPWPMRAHHSQITLSRLNDQCTREMIAGILSRSALTKEVVDTVVRRTDGVPLFAEELTRLMLEGDGRVVAREIPATLQDSLMARLDRIGPGKEVAQIGAVIGREFSYELLQAVAPMPEEELQAALAKLIDAELIYARGIAPDATYQFKHALIQDAAYEALLKTRRRELHRRVARAITEKFPALGEAQPQVLARHWSDAGEADPAIAAWKKAGEQAYSRGAFTESEEACRHALTILNTLPESPERDSLELELTGAQAQVLMPTKGWSAPETVAAFARALALAEKTGNLRELVVQGFRNFGVVHTIGDHSRAMAMARQLLDIAEREGSPSSLAFAHQALAQIQFYHGNMAESEEHFSRWYAVHEAPEYRQFVAAHILAMTYGALAELLLGQTGSARKHMAEAIANAQAGNIPYEIGFARYFEAIFYDEIGETLRAEATINDALSIAEQNDFAFLRDYCLIEAGWIQAKLGKAADQAIATIKRGMSGLNAVGAHLALARGLIFLSEAQFLAGTTDDALATIEDAVESSLAEPLYQPFTLMQRGDIRLRLQQSEAAEVDFREALALANKMNQKTYELRIATRLARLLRDTDRRDEARATLGDIYGRFTEGFDTADLKDAKALLDELSS